VKKTLSNISITLPTGSIPACWFAGSEYPDPRSPGQFSASTFNVHGGIYGDQGAAEADFIGYSVAASNYYRNISNKHLRGVLHNVFRDASNDNVILYYGHFFSRAVRCGAP
jgi:hypothetical protein